MNFENPQMPLSEIPSATAMEFELLPKRYRKYRAVGFAILFLVLSASWIGPLIAQEYLTVFISGGIWLLFVSLAFGLESLRYQAMGVALRKHDLTYRKGFIFKKQVTLPFNRIQHTEISQGPLARKFKLSTLKVYTAGGSGSDLSIAGLDPERAQELKDYIAKAVSESE